MSRDTREAIMRAALEVFGERGFHATTVPEVARRAGVGTGTIYGHFKSKDELGAALYLRWKRQYVEDILDAIPEQGTWRSRFRGLWQGMVAFAGRYPGVLEYLEFHHHSIAIDEAESRALSMRLDAALVALVEAGQAEEIFVEVPAPLLLQMVYGSFLRLLRVGASGALVLTPELFATAEERAWVMIRR